MVTTDPSEDAELPTTRLRMTSVSCLGLILQCPSFLHVHFLLWFMFLFTDDHRPYTLKWLHLWCGRSPLCWSRLFLIVLHHITNLSFPWHHCDNRPRYARFHAKFLSQQSILCTNYTTIVNLLMTTHKQMLSYYDLLKGMTRDVARHKSQNTLASKAPVGSHNSWTSISIS